jgi:hypothetical protein
MNILYYIALGTGWPGKGAGEEAEKAERKIGCFLCNLTI